MHRTNPNDTDFVIWANMRKLRIYHEYTYRQISKLLGIPYTTYSNYENKRARPPIEVLIGLSEIYLITVEDIVKSDMVFKLRGV